MQNEPLAQEKEPGNDRISLLQHVTVPFAPLLYPSSSATPPPLLDDQKTTYGTNVATFRSGNKNSNAAAEDVDGRGISG